MCLWPLYNDTQFALNTNRHKGSKMPTDLRGPLAGLRILDASRVLAGPLCGQHLGDLGAEVIKIEHPRNPDETRTWGTQAADELSVYYLACNRNKRAICLDLKQPAAQLPAWQTSPGAQLAPSGTLLHTVVFVADWQVRHAFVGSRVPDG